MKTAQWLAIGTVVCLFINFRAAGTVIYDNSATNTDTQLTVENGQQVGDEINLASGDSDYYLTNFSFNFYTSIASGDDVTLEVLFQLNDSGTYYNGYETPGTVFYDSGAFSIGPGTNDGGLDFDISDLSQGDTIALNSYMLMPTNFTFSVIVQGLGEGDSFGMDLYNSPVVGSSAPDYWFNNGSWELLTNSAPVNFGSVFEGSLTPAPEPTAIALSVLSGAGLLLAARRRKQ